MPMKAMQKLPIYKTLLGMLAVGIGVGLFLLNIRFFSDPAKEIAYLTEAAERGTIEVSINGVGEVCAAQLVTIGAQVSGKIEKIHVRLGSRVQEGDPIAEIDATTQRSELETRKARLRTYTAQLRSHAIAADVAVTQYDREKKLYSEKSTSKQDFETAEKEYAKAWADMEATKSLITQEEIAIAKAEADLGYTRIVAPMAGTIISLPVEVGQTVNANQTTPTIALLADLSQMEIKIQISEGDITKISDGMPVSFYILSEPGTTFTSQLHAIDPANTDLTDESEPRNSSSSSSGAVYYYGRMLVANPNGKLRIGMTTHCTIAVARAENALRVPSVSVKDEDGRSYVYVLKGDAPEKRFIETGVSNSLFTEVKSNLREGEQVVTSRMSQAEIDARIKGRQR